MRDLTSQECVEPYAYLPWKRVTKYARNQPVFQENQPTEGLHLVVTGRIKLYLGLGDVPLNFFDIIFSGELFGESALLYVQHRGESAVALEDSELISWTAAEVERIVESEKNARKTFIQMFAQRCIDLEERLAIMALGDVRKRVIWALLHLANRAGTASEDGWVRIPAVTHKLLAEYIGTSREMVTGVLGSLRHMEDVRYTRQHIEVKRDGLAHLYGDGSAYRVDCTPAEFPA